MKIPCLRSAFSSPRMRRYFQPPSGSATALRLFSAHAEVFPTPGLLQVGTGTLLRACGGISINISPDESPAHSSPRMRRYFHRPRAAPIAHHLFSAHAEVFPPERTRAGGIPTLLRACGGISIPCSLVGHKDSSSPRMRRYFGLLRLLRYRILLFSAHAEVFPTSAYSPSINSSLLRACGGISCLRVHAGGNAYSSPRMRRYFPSRGGASLMLRLFSAHAEVFP